MFLKSHTLMGRRGAQGDRRPGERSREGPGRQPDRLKAPAPKLKPVVINIPSIPATVPPLPLVTGPGQVLRESKVRWQLRC